MRPLFRDREASQGEVRSSNPIRPLNGTTRTFTVAALMSACDPNRRAALNAIRRRAPSSVPRSSCSACRVWPKLFLTSSMPTARRRRKALRYSSMACARRRVTGASGWVTFTLASCNSTPSVVEKPEGVVRSSSLTSARADPLPEYAPEVAGQTGARSGDPAPECDP